MFSSSCKLEDLFSSFSERRNLDNLILDNLKGKGRKISQEIEKFSFKYQKDSLRNSSSFVEVTLGDAQYDFCLCYDDNESFFGFYSLCGLSFDKVSSEMLFVRQIQGSQNSGYFSWLGEEQRKDILSRLNWEKILLSHLISLGDEFGFSRVCLQGAINNKWLRETYEKINEFMWIDFSEFLNLPNDILFENIESFKKKGLNVNDLHLLPARAFQRYDQTALDLEFSPDGNGDYVLNLN